MNYNEVFTKIPNQERHWIEKAGESSQVIKATVTRIKRTLKIYGSKVDSGTSSTAAGCNQNENEVGDDYVQHERRAFCQPSIR